MERLNRPFEQRLKTLLPEAEIPDLGAIPKDRSFGADKGKRKRWICMCNGHANQIPGGWDERA